MAFDNQKLADVMRVLAQVPIEAWHVLDRCCEITGYRKEELAYYLNYLLSNEFIRVNIDRRSLETQECRAIEGIVSERHTPAHSVFITLTGAGINALSNLEILLLPGRDPPE